MVVQIDLPGYRLAYNYWAAIIEENFYRTIFL